MQRKRFFFGVFLWGSMHASKFRHDLEGVVHYPGMKSLQAAHDQEQKEIETVTLNLRAQPDETEGPCVQRRNAADFAAERAAQQIAVIPRRYTTIRRLLAWCFCISQRENEGDSISLPPQENETPSMRSISPIFFGGRCSDTPPPDTFEQLRRESLELVDVSLLSKLSVQNRRSLTPYPSISLSQELSVFEEHLI